MGCSGSKEPGVDGGGAHRARELAVSAKGETRNLTYNMFKKSRGDRFDEVYEFQEGELGSAAMGCVVRGVCKRSTGEMFACKTFMVSSVKNRSQQRHILSTLHNEIDLLRRLDHPNIIRAYEAHEVGKDLHLIMELCRGGDLNARRYGEVQAAVAVRQVLSAIHYSHRHGICHRDLKFENILWESTAPDAQIKLIDFGMSARFEAGVKMKERVGTPYTMAPEVLQEQYTEKADLWSVGCIAFHLIAGVSPFESEDEVDTMRRILEAQYYWPAGSKVSSEAKEFVYNLLRRDPRSRWNAEQALASRWIQRFALGGGEATLPPDKPIRTRLVSSMRNYESYGVLRRIVLMVVAYFQSSEELGPLRREFVDFDTEKNGKISRGEMQVALAQIGVSQDEIERLFATLDVDQSGDIQYIEFLAATIEANGMMEEDRLRFAFERLDTDGSGYITVANLMEVMSPFYDERTIHRTLEEVDTSKDGQVDWQEFLTLMRWRPPTVSLATDEEVLVDHVKTGARSDAGDESGGGGGALAVISLVASAGNIRGAELSELSGQMGLDRVAMESHDERRIGDGDVDNDP